MITVLHYLIDGDDHAYGEALGDTPDYAYEEKQDEANAGTDTLPEGFASTPAKKDYLTQIISLQSRNRKVSFKI